MVLDVNKVVFTRYGVSEPSALDPNRVTIYLSPSRIKSMSYSGDARTTIIKSTSIPLAFHPYLAQMNAKVSLGTTGNVFRNAHVYLDGAETLDGYLRVCYISPAGDNELKVSEYAKRSRGAHYSSLFLILKSKMQAAGFPSDSESFKVTLDRVMEFVEIINEINREYEEGKYVLVLGRGHDQLDTGCFHRVYFIQKDIENPAVGEVDEAEEEWVDDLIREKSIMSDEQAKIALDALISIQDIGGKAEEIKAGIKEIKRILERLLS